MVLRKSSLHCPLSMVSLETEKTLLWASTGLYTSMQSFCLETPRASSHRPWGPRGASVPGEFYVGTDLSAGLSLSLGQPRSLYLNHDHPAAQVSSLCTRMTVPWPHSVPLSLRCVRRCHKKSLNTVHHGHWFQEHPVQKAQPPSSAGLITGGLERNKEGGKAGWTPQGSKQRNQA